MALGFAFEEKKNRKMTLLKLFKIFLAILIFSKTRSGSSPEPRAAGVPMPY